MTPEEKIEQLGYKLPMPRSPIGSYMRTQWQGNVIYVSGTGSRSSDMSYCGKVGRDLSIEEGYKAAQLSGLSIITTLKEALHDLDRVKRIVKVIGFINASDDFTEHPKVLNGASDLFLEIFGELGKHARSAIGVSSLPGNLAVEIEVVVEC